MFTERLCVVKVQSILGKSTKNLIRYTTIVSRQLSNYKLFCNYYTVQIACLIDLGQNGARLIDSVE